MRAEGRRASATGGRRRRGFTLVELAVVVLIIGILLAFILAAAFGSVERARERATQALIMKLDVAVTERLDALLSRSIAPNGTHQWLAAIAPVPGATSGAVGSVNDLMPWGLVSSPRAEVIARIDLVRMEMPDVFTIRDATLSPNSYPLDFGGLPFPLPNVVGPPQPIVTYVLPLGHAVGPGFTPSSAEPVPTGPPFYSVSDFDPDGDGVPNLGPGSSQAGFVTPGLGIYGASYDARAAVGRLLNLLPAGCNGADDDGDGLIDELDEGVPPAGRDGVDNDGNGLIDDRAEHGISVFLRNHDHATARSEMLYALLVEGVGPLGNAFNPEDFTGDEVRDTDGDGLPEFVDGWGKPLQFYRWPIYYPSPGVQEGSAWFGDLEPVIVPDPRAGLATRPRFALDTTGQLVAPGWWGDLTAATLPVPISIKAALFNRYFVSTIDPNFGQSYPGGGPSLAANSACWDRSGYYARRSFACKFLIVSGGPDQQTGLFQVADATIRANLAAGNPDANSVLMVGNPLPTDAGSGNYVPVQIGEGWASYANGWPLAAARATGLVTGPPEEARDNLDNHQVMSVGGGLR
ncbi:MAG: hypothetical protein KatS3mg108_0947 [Isosphaeraceae bacterium]|jgi:prepilin-type N-terminal cleavage/methylation domain-containing protein|nr:MAG: hypothetical protein KatS3mg108_0947 [Isosphaeraceae bacterium]